MKPQENLPFIDEHTVEVAADPESTWRALEKVLGRSFTGRAPAAFAAVVGCRDRAAGQSFQAVPGTALVGFRVSAAERPRLLVLDGQHHFARYRLTFRLEAAGGGTRLAAATHATFPGLGRAYRLLVISSGAHALVTRRMLHLVRAAARETAGGAGRAAPDETTS